MLVGLTLEEKVSTGLKVPRVFPVKRSVASYPPGWSRPGGDVSQ